MVRVQHEHRRRLFERLRLKGQLAPGDSVEIVFVIPRAATEVCAGVFLHPRRVEPLRQRARERCLAAAFGTDDGYDLRHRPSVDQGVGKRSAVKESRNLSQRLVKIFPGQLADSS